MTDAISNLNDDPASESPAPGEGEPDGPPIWLRASLTDLVDLDFEAPIVASDSADSTDLGQMFRAAVDDVAGGARSETAAIRVFSMLSAVMGMQLKAQEPNEPFGPMVIWADGRRSAAPGDFRGEPLDVLSQMAVSAKHPVLHARLADVCWFLDRKRTQLAAMAITAPFMSRRPS
jgi:hypothetical protein